MADSDIDIQVTADTGSAVGQLSQLNQSLAGMGTSMANVSTRMYRMGHTLQEVGQNMYSIGQKATVGISVPLALAGKSLIQTGATMKAMHQTFKTVFGDLTADAQAWSKNLSKSVGLSSGIIDETNLNFRKMAGAFGLTGKDASEFSQKWTKMTLDLAAFNDVPIDEATERMQSGLRGEADAVEKLGIFMGETSLKQQMLTMGIEGQYSALDNATKSQVLFALATKQTGQATGQATREASSYQNSIANLKQSYKEFAEQFYLAVEPAVMDFLAQLKALLERLKTLTPEQIKFYANIAKWLIIIFPLIMAIGGVIEAFGRMLKLMAFAWKAIMFMNTQLALLPARYLRWSITMQGYIRTATRGIKAMALAVRGFMTASSGVFGLTVGWLIVIVVAIAVAVYFIIKYWDQIKTATKKVWTSVTAFLANEWAFISATASKVWNSVVTFFSETWRKITDTVHSAWAGIKAYFTKLWSDITTKLKKDSEPIVAVAKGIFNKISDDIKDFVATAKVVFGVFYAVFDYLWNGLIKPILQWVGGMFVAIGELIVWVIKQLIIMAIDWLAEKWQWLYANVIQPVGEKIKGFFTSVGQVFSDMYTKYVLGTIDAFKSKWAELTGVVDSKYQEEVVPVVQGMQDKIVEVQTTWQKAVEAVKGYWTSFTTYLSEAWNTYVVPFLAKVNAVWVAVQTEWNRIWSAITAKFASWANTLKAQWDQTWGYIKGAFSGFITGIKTEWDSLWSQAKTKFDNFIDGIKTAFTNFKNGFKLPRLKMVGSWDLTPPNFSVPSLEWYAKGGIANSASVIGVGEAGSEAIVPLTNNRTMSMLGAKISEFMPDNGNTEDNSPKSVVINMTGPVSVRDDRDIEEIAQKLYKLQQRESRRLGRSK